MAKAGPVLTILVIAVVAIVGILAYSVFQPGVQEVITGEVVAPADCIARAQAAGKLGEASTIYASAYDGAPDNVETQRASTAYMWKTNNPTQIIADAKTLSASATTAISGFSRGDTINGVSFDSTYYGEPIAPACVDADSVNVKFRVWTKSDAMAVTFKGNDTVTGTIVSFAGVAASETVDEVHFVQNQSDKAYKFAGFHVDLVASSNVTTASVSSTENEWSDTAQRSKAGLSSPASISFSKTSGSPFGSNTRRDIADIVFETDPIILLENDEIVAKNFIVSLDADRCGTAENIVIYTFDKGYFRSEANRGVAYGYETDAANPADAGADDDAGGSFQGTIACTAS